MVISFWVFFRHSPQIGIRSFPLVFMVQLQILFFGYLTKAGLPAAIIVRSTLEWWNYFDGKHIILQRTPQSLHTLLRNTFRVQLPQHYLPRNRMLEPWLERNDILPRVGLHRPLIYNSSTRPRHIATARSPITICRPSRGHSEAVIYHQRCEIASYPAVTIFAASSS